MWYVGFEPADRPWWQRVLCGPELQHVSALGVVNGGYVVIEWTEPYLIVAPLTESQFEAGLGRMFRDVTVIAKMPPAGRSPRRGLRLGLWCVPAVAHILGLGPVLTPRGLLRAMLAAGAELVLDRRKRRERLQEGQAEGPRPRDDQAPA